MNEVTQLLPPCLQETCPADGGKSVPDRISCKFFLRNIVEVGGGDLLTDTPCPIDLISKFALEQSDQRLSELRERLKQNGLDVVGVSRTRIPGEL